MQPEISRSAGLLPDSWTWERIAIGLVCSTLVYNVAEAGIALWFGSEAESVVLIGFGLDSLIETAAATMLLWRLWIEARGADSERVQRTEHLVHRFVGADPGGWLDGDLADPGRAVQHLTNPIRSLFLVGSRTCNGSSCSGRAPDCGERVRRRGIVTQRCWSITQL